MLKKVCCICFILFLFVSARAQKQGQALIDSLVRELSKTKDDTNRVNVLNAISYNYFFVNANNGIGYGRQSLALAQKLKWQQGIATAYKNIGNGFMSMSSYDSALDAYDKALKIFIAINNKDGQARALGNIGSIYDDKGDYTKALEYAFRALSIYEETGDKKGKARIYTTIGTLYETPKKYTEALHYDSLALVISLELGDRQSAAINLGNMGNVYSSLKNYRKAIEYDSTAMVVYEELEDSSAIANKMSNIADVYAEIPNLPKSLDYAFRSLKIYETTGDRQGMGITLGNIGGKYRDIATDTTGKIKRGELIPAGSAACLQKAIIYTAEAMKIFEETGNKNELQSAYKDLYEEYELSGNFVKYHRYKDQYNRLHDSLFQNSVAVNFANLEKDQVVKDKEKQELLTKLEIKNERNQRIFFSIGALMLLVIIGLIVRERKRSEKLLTNVLPPKIAERLKKKEHPIADHFEHASIMFADMAGFTKYSDKKDPKIIVNVLNDVFTKFDAIAEKHGLEKIKTIGDCYMAAAGLPQHRADHADAAAAMALDIKNSMAGYTAPDGTPISFRIGLHCGPVVAGVIGKKKFIYDLWGDAVNTASRMESSGLPGEIHCTDTFKKSLSPNYVFIDRGIMDIKSKGPMQTWLLSAHAQ